MSLWSPDRQLYQHSFGIRRRSLGMHPINPLAVVLDSESTRLSQPRHGWGDRGRGRGKDDDALSPVHRGATAWRRPWRVNTRASIISPLLREGQQFERLSANLKTPI